MASELRVNTLKDASGNNSVATSVVFNGTSKVWVNFDGTASGAAARDSYNVSSMTDHQAGSYSVNFSSAMSDANYAATMNNRTGGGKQSIVTLAKDFTASASVQRIYVVNPASPGVLQDEDFCMVSINGDLA
tara:strand:+ start:523 stop:918 length:396 start_codon:yes stop_codon:yes gene_type:complete